MKVELSSLLNSASGRIGNSIIQSNGSGFIAKKYVSNRNNQAPKKTAINSLFVMFLNQWNALSLENKQSWSTKAATFPFINNLGHVYHISGYNLFMTLNFNKWNFSQSIISTCPDFSSCSSATINIDTFEVSFSQLQITYTIPSDRIYGILLFATPLLNTNRKPRSSDYRLMYSAAPISSASTNFYTAWTTLFGAPIRSLGSISIMCRLINIADYMSSQDSFDYESSIFS
jgi:hypothetical protein